MRGFFRKFAGHFLPSEENAYRPHLLTKPWLLFFLTVVISAEGLYVAGSYAGQSAHNLLSAVVPAEVIALTNNERVQAGDATLAENAQLDAAAQSKADDMAAKGYFSHVGPDGKQPWSWISGAGYSYRYAGENLAVRFDESADVVNAWMASPTHKANIVKPVYTEIGLGVAQGMYEGSPATFIVQYFGTPQGQVAAVENVKTAVASATGSSTVSEQGNAAKPAAATTSEVAGAETQAAAKPVQAHVAATTTPSSTANLAPQAPTPASEQSSIRAEAQAFLRASEASQDSTSAILGGIALILIVVICLAVFVHIEIQPTEMLLGGAFVTLVAISLWMINGTLNFGGTSGSQSAAAINSAHEAPSIMVGEGASTELQ